MMRVFSIECVTKNDTIGQLIMMSDTYVMYEYGSIGHVT